MHIVINLKKKCVLNTNLAGKLLSAHVPRENRLTGLKSFAEVIGSTQFSRLPETGFCKKKQKSLTNLDSTKGMANK